jgi:hypothetical protein
MKPMTDKPRAATVSASTTDVTAHRPWLTFAEIAVLALILRAAGAWFTAERIDDGPSVLRAGGDGLTNRQDQMVEVVQDYISGWQATDGDLVASFVTDDGFVEYPAQGWLFNAADGTLQDHITNGPYETLRTLDPMLVHDDRIVLTGVIDSMSVNWISVVRFTTAGDLAIISETLTYWPS